MSTKIDAEMAEKLRQGFKYFNKLMVIMWRLGLGAWFKLWPEGFGQVMVITHRGRTSGQNYRTPVNYAFLGQKLYCIAGFGKIADWYQNIIANPAVEIWLPDGWWSGTAEDMSSCPERPEIMRAVVEASGFAGPMFGVDPRKLDSPELMKATRSYKIVQIHLAEARTGPGGPGELAVIWQIATFVLLGWVLILRKRQRKE